MALNIDSYLANHAAAVTLRAQRAQVIAGNLANADTPNYKARDVNFANSFARATQAMKGQSTSVNSSKHVRLSGNTDSVVMLASSHPQHLYAGGTSQHGGPLAAFSYHTPSQPSIDGNTVQSDVEQSKFAENALRYQASMQFLNNRITGLLKTIRGE